MTLKKLKSALVACLVIVAAGSSMPAMAAKSAPPKKADNNITSMWIIWVKDGQFGKFEAAIKQYAAWRKSQNDPFTWLAYKPIVGSDLGYYVVRSEEHTWTEIQAEHDWDQAHQGQDGGSHFGDYVGHEEHYFTYADNAHTHWIPNKNYKYFGVTHYQVKPGMGDAVRSAIDKVQKAVTQAKWPYSYAIEYTIGGQGGMDIAEPMETLEGMAEPKPTMMDVLSKSLGSKKAAKALMHDFGSSIQSHDYTIYEFEPDLTPH